MNEREFKLLVRGYFACKDIAESHLTFKESAIKDLPSFEKLIRKELSRFTQQEQQELPFKD